MSQLSIQNQDNSGQLFLIILALYKVLNVKILMLLIPETALEINHKCCFIPTCKPQTGFGLLVIVVKR